MKKAKKIICSNCYKEGNAKINTIRHSPSFSGDKNPPGELPNTFFCSQQCKKERIKQTRQIDQKNTPYLAELDESMNYCEYFTRQQGNDGYYIRDGFKTKVNGLWDYKTEGIKEFKELFKKHFGHYNRFKLHSRYN